MAHDIPPMVVDVKNFWGGSQHPAENKYLARPSAHQELKNAMKSLHSLSSATLPRRKDESMGIDL